MSDCLRPACRHTALVCTLLLFMTGHLPAQSPGEPGEPGSPARPATVAVCTACHGEDGNAVEPQWPNLAGQNATYLAIQLRNFRDGVRQNEVMAPLVSQLSDGDIDALAGWYSQQNVKASLAADAELVERGRHRAGYCLACHGLSGITVNSDWPNLAGQQAAYMVQQLESIKSGERTNVSMSAIISAFSAEDIRAVSAYYSQLSPAGSP